MKKFTFDVPMYATISVEAETETEGAAAAEKWLKEGDDVGIVIDLADGFHFEAGQNTESPIELLDEEEIE